MPKFVLNILALNRIAKPPLANLRAGAPARGLFFLYTGHLDVKCRAPGTAHGSHPGIAVHLL
jgi:hypothetical protein